MSIDNCVIEVNELRQRSCGFKSEGYTPFVVYIALQSEGLDNKGKS